MLEIVHLHAVVQILYIWVIFRQKRGYVIYSLWVQPEVSKSHVHEVPKNNGLIFTKARFQNCDVKQW